MKITSIDIETTGLDPKTCQILQIGAVTFDTNSEDFTYDTYSKIIDHKQLTGTPFAINMNQTIINEMLSLQNRIYNAEKTIENILNGKQNVDEQLLNEQCEHLRILNNKIIRTGDVAEDLLMYLTFVNGYFIDDMGKKHLNVTGKNFGQFDQKFLNELPKFKETIRPMNRQLDPIGFYTYDSDDVPPCLQQCKERAIQQIHDEFPQYIGLIESSDVTHDALDDALDVAKLIWFGFKRNKKWNKCIHSNEDNK